MIKIRGGIDYQVPIPKADVFNTALPAAEANWLASDIVPTNSPSLLRIYICVSVAGIIRIARTQGVTLLTEDINRGATLVANSAYIFDVLWSRLDRLNVRYSVSGGVIRRLIINEMGGGL